MDAYADQFEKVANSLMRPRGIFVCWSCVARRCLTLGLRPSRTGAGSLPVPTCPQSGADMSVRFSSGAASAISAMGSSAARPQTGRLRAGQTRRRPSSQAGRAPPARSRPTRRRSPSRRPSRCRRRRARRTPRRLCAAELGARHVVRVGSREPPSRCAPFPSRPSPARRGSPRAR